MKIFTFLSVALLLTGLSAAATRPSKLIELPSDTLKKTKTYIIHSKTKNILEITLSKAKKGDTAINIRYGYPTPAPNVNTVTRDVRESNKQGNKDQEIPAFDKIEIVKGKYEDMQSEKYTKYKNLFTFTTLTFPIRLKLNSGSEMIDLELIEAGNWVIVIDLKNN